MNTYFRFFSLIAIMGGIIACSPRETPNTLIIGGEAAPLRGEVASVVEKAHVIIDGKPNAAWNVTYKFNQEGNVERIVGTHRGAPLYTITREYNEKGALIKEERLDESGTPLTVSYYTYDAKGNRVKEVNENRKGAEGSNARAYSVRDDVEIEKGGLSALSVEGMYSNVFDEKGNCIASYAFSRETDILLYITFSTYDEKGRLRTKETRNTNDVVEERWLYEYDDKGNIIREERFLGGMRIGVTESAYSPEGRKVEETYYSSNAEPYRRERITYDDKGNLLLKVATSNGMRVASNTYTYDEAGNRTAVFVYTLNKEENDFVLTSTYTVDYTYKTQK